MRFFAVSKPLDVAIYAAVGTLCWYLAWRTLTRYDARGIDAFSAVLALEGVWAFNSAAKLTIQDLGVLFALARTDVVMMLVVPLFWYKFATEYVGKTGLRSAIVLWSGAAVALLGTAMVLVAPSRTVWTAVESVQEPFVHLHPLPSPIYLALALVAGLLFLGGFVHIVEAVLTTRQTTLAMVALSIGMTFPVFFELEYLLRIGLFHQVNYTSMGVGAFTILTTVAVFSDLFTVNPISRKEILANVNDGVLVLDDRRRVVDYNDRLMEYFEPETAPVIGEAVQSVFPTVAEAISYVEGSETFIDVNGGGEERSYRLDVSEIGQGESTIGWGVVVTDVTALKRQQRELRRQNEQLDAFASTVSHDLRNPLNVAELRLDLAMEGDDDEEHLLAVADAHERMETIIDDLLTLARGGQTVGVLEMVEVDAVATEAWNSIDSRDGTLEVERNGRLLADRARLQSVFENLFRNAVEHAGGDVTVTVALEDDKLVVCDDGPGVTDEKQDRVFEYGYSTADGGTGLGLAIVKTMVETHGWEIELDRSDGRGARFVISGVRVADGDEPSPDLISTGSVFPG